MRVHQVPILLVTRNILKWPGEYAMNILAPLAAFYGELSLRIKLAPAVDSGNGNNSRT